jgi:hypothetical protein
VCAKERWEGGKGVTAIRVADWELRNRKTRNAIFFVDKILHPVALLFRFRVEEEVTCK